VSRILVFFPAKLRYTLYPCYFPVCRKAPFWLELPSPTMFPSRHKNVNVFWSLLRSMVFFLNISRFLFVSCQPQDFLVFPPSVAEPCHFAYVPVQVPGSCQQSTPNP
jgi:hypothetical protein